MWRLFALLLLTAPAAAQTVTIDLAALDAVGRARPHRQLVPHQLPPLLRIEAPVLLDPPPDADLTPRPPRSEAAADTPRRAVLALPVKEPPSPIRVRTMPVQLARFAPAPPQRVAPRLPGQVEPAANPVLDAVRLLLAFAPEFDPRAPDDPIALRQARSPVLPAFPVFERVDAPVADLPELAPMRSATLHFAPAAASLDESGLASLDGIAALLEAGRSRRAQLVVWLQSGEDPDAARRLAWARMVALRAHLLSRGVAASRLEFRATVAAHGSEAVRIALLD